jgi:thioredoxin reductase
MPADAIAEDEHHDVVIVGAGAAGVSCALECFDIRLDTAVFEADERPGGQLVEIPLVRTSRRDVQRPLRDALRNRTIRVIAWAVPSRHARA